jgi:hypothetical protein
MTYRVELDCYPFSLLVAAVDRIEAVAVLEAAYPGAGAAIKRLAEDAPFEAGERRRKPRSAAA